MHSHKVARYSVALALLVAVLSVVVGCELLVSFGDPGLRVCTPGARSSDGCAYGGPAGTEGVGICGPGEKVCKDDGLAWGECSAPTLPKAKEDCSTPADDNCNGAVNEASAGCCTPGTTVACYTGPAGTEDVGAECKSGTQTCGNDGMLEVACVGEVTPQQETCADPRDEDCDGRDCVEWAQLLGDTTNQELGGIAVDAAGNIILAGSFHGTIELGDKGTLKEAGGGDAFVLKLDPMGKAIWGQRFGDAAEQRAGSVAVDSTGDIIFGGVSASSFSVDKTQVPEGIFVAKLDGTDGHVVWAKGLGGMCAKAFETTVASVAVTSQNDAAVAGSFCLSISLDDAGITSPNGKRDGFIVLFRGGDGSTKKADGYWGKSFNDQSDASATSQALSVAANQNAILVAGKFQSSISLGFSNYASSAGGYDVFVARIKPDGTPNGIAHYGSTGNEEGVSIAVDSTGSYYLAGQFGESIDLGGGALTGATGSSSIFLAKFAWEYSYGKYEWSKAFGAPTAVAWPMSIAVDSAGNLVFAGLFAGSLDFGTGVLASGTNFNMFLTKLDNSGNGIWVRQFDDPIDTSMGGLSLAGGVAAVTPTGESIFAGVTSSLPLDLGTGALTPAGATDIFVAKFGL